MSLRLGGASTSRTQAEAQPTTPMLKPMLRMLMSLRWTQEPPVVTWKARRGGGSLSRRMNTCCSSKQSWNSHGARASMRCVQTRRVWLPLRDQSCVSWALGCERATAPKFRLRYMNLRLCLYDRQFYVVCLAMCVQCVLLRFNFISIRHLIRYTREKRKFLTRGGCDFPGLQ